MLKRLVDENKLRLANSRLISKKLDHRHNLQYQSNLKASSSIAIPSQGR